MKVTVLSFEILYSKFIPRDFQTTANGREKIFFFPVRMRVDGTGNYFPACGGAVFTSGKGENSDKGDSSKNAVISKPLERSFLILFHLNQ